MKTTNSKVDISKLLPVFLYFSIILFTSAPLFAQKLPFEATVENDGTVIIKMENAIEMAIAENLSLKAQKYSLSAKKRSNDTRLNALAPTLSLSTAFAKPNEGTVAAPDHWRWSWQLNAQLALSAQIYNGIRYLSQDYMLGLITYADAEARLKRDIKKSFYSILVLQESISVMQSTIETAEKSYRQADVNYRNGLASELDRLQAQVTLETLKPDLLEVINSYKSTLLSFKEVLGFDDNVKIRLDGVIDPEVYEIDVNNLIYSSLSNRLDIRQIVQQLKLLETDLSSSRNSRLPSLLLGYQKNMVYSEDPFDSDPIGSNPLKNSDEWIDQGAFTISLSWSIDSIIPWLSKDTEVKNKKDMVKQSELQLSSALRQADIQIRTIIMNLEKSVEKISSLELSRKLAQRTYDLAFEGYNAGTVEMLTLETAMNQLQDAQMKILQEKYNYQAALLDLEYAINRPLENIYDKRD